MKYHIDFDIELRKNDQKGIYIALEGIDGSGKTTQVEELAEYFESKGKKVVRTREPRKEGIIGDLVSKILKGELRIPPKAFQYLFSTDRVIHLEEVVLPALKEGKVVISDRSFWSAVVYGILDKSKDYDYKEANQILIAQSILSFYHQFTAPDYTFYLHINLDEAMKRIAQKHEENAKEIYETREKVEAVRKGYDWMMKKFQTEITIIDGEKSITEVTKEMIDFFEK